MECAQIYSLFQHCLRADFTDPPNAPNIVKYRLVDMYTKCTEPSIKEDIVSAFPNPDGKALLRHSRILHLVVLQPDSHHLGCLEAAQNYQLFYE